MTQVCVCGLEESKAENDKPSGQLHSYLSFFGGKKSLLLTLKKSSSVLVSVHPLCSLSCKLHWLLTMLMVYMAKKFAFHLI